MWCMLPLGVRLMVLPSQCRMKCGKPWHHVPRNYVTGSRQNQASGHPVPVWYIHWSVTERKRRKHEILNKTALWLLSDNFTRGSKSRCSSSNSGNPSVNATLYAGNVGKRAYEWAEKKHGVFSYYLLEGLNGGAVNSQGEVTICREVLGCFWCYL